MSKVGLVLGGGGITGASFHFGALLAIEMATGWDPGRADVIVGTSSGAFTAAMLRGGQLNLDTFIGEAQTRDDVSSRLRKYVYRRARPRGVIRWLRRGVLPSVVHPDVGLVLGSPALYKTDGIVEWVEDVLGDLADGWPDAPTVIVAYDLQARKRVPFGTEAAPDVALKTAVAASAAVPCIFEPVDIEGRWYADGGVASGTSADLLLASADPLDLVIVIAPLAASEPRPGARFYEDVFDRLGRTALDAELEKIARAWPSADIVVLRPDEHVLAAARPNPMSLSAAIPAFLRTLRSLSDHLGNAGTWEILERHLVPGRVA